MRSSLAGALCLAVGLEFLLVRLLSRVGVYIPKGGAALEIYQGAVLVGEVAFNLSLGLAAVVLAMALWQEQRWVAALLAVALLGSPAVTVAALLLAVLALGGRALRRAPREARVGLGLILLAHSLRYTAAGLQRLWMEWAMPGELPVAAWLLLGGELLAVLAPIALAAPALVGGRSRWGLPAVGMAGVVAGGLLVNPDLTGVLAMFSLGFTLSWPPVLYVLAAGAAVLAPCALRGEQRLAVVLLFLAGLGLNVNQQQAVVLAGWALLAVSTRSAVRGEEVEAA